MKGSNPPASRAKPQPPSNPPAPPEFNNTFHFVGGLPTARGTRANISANPVPTLENLVAEQFPVLITELTNLTKAMREMASSYDRLAQTLIEAAAEDEEDDNVQRTFLDGRPIS